VLGDAPAGRGGTWNRDGTILFSPGREGGVFRVAASGGSATPVTSVERPRHRGHLWPEFLPDGRHFLYLADSTDPEHHVIYVAAIDSTDRKPLVTAASNATYTRDGHLLFSRDRRLVAQPFDVDRLELAGEPVTLVDELHHQLELDHKADFSVAAEVLAYRSPTSTKVQLVWRDRAGRQAALIDDSAQYFEPTLSPDGKRIAVARSEPPSKRFGFGLGNWTSDIWIFDVTSGAASRFTFDSGAEWEPVWSPDGARLVYSSNRTGVLDLYQKAVSLTGGDDLLFHSNTAKHAESWSPDGRFILFSTLEPKTGWDLWMLPMFGDRQPVRLMQGEFSESGGQISPDGRWLAYTSNESGRSEIYVRSFPALEGKWQISNHGGSDPRWRSDGKELFYIAADRRLMAVAVATVADFEPGVTRPLFDTGLQHVEGDARNHYDVSRDGRRFLVMQPVADTRSSPFTIVVNGTVRRLR
jgi:Tol biopolymer transport system component